MTHDVREALMLASRIVLLREGRVELAAAPEEFVAAENAERGSRPRGVIRAR